MTNIITYTLTATSNDIVFWAESFKEATGEGLIIASNSLSVPASCGTGKFDFYELGDGIALRVINCYFHHDFLFKRKVDLKEMHYCAFLNFSDAAVTFYSSEMPDGVVFNKNEPFSIITSNGALEVSVPANSYFKVVVINCAASWLHEKLAIDPYDFKKIMSFAALQQYFLRTCLPGIKSAITKSIANVLGKDNISINKLVQNEDMHRICALKEKIAAQLDEDLPSVKDAARICLMSVSKFSRLFKKMFHASYADFFLGLRLGKACDLLKQQYSIQDVSFLCGYKNIAAFSKAFKRKFHVAPLQYKKLH